MQHTAVHRPPLLHQLMNFYRIPFALATALLIAACGPAETHVSNDVERTDVGTETDDTATDTGDATSSPDTDTTADTGSPDTAIDTGDATSSPDTGTTADTGSPDTAVDTTTDTGSADTAIDTGTTTDTGSADTGATEPPEDHPNELIGDRHMWRGAQAKDPVSGDPSFVMSPGWEPGAPVWSLGQWGSDSDIGAVAPETLADGSVRWSDRYGGVTIGPWDSEHADFSFRVNAYEEYDGVYRTRTDPVTWPHLLVEQRLSPPGQAGPGCPPLDELASLTFSADARLLYDERNLSGGFDPTRHGGHYLVYFTIQNLASPGAPGYGDYLWFGLGFYDDRDPMPGLYVNGDDATGKLIYNIGLEQMSDVPLTDNAWHSLEVDLLPHMLLALEEAWSRGYLPDSHNVHDYRVGGMNIGWEVPGLNHAELQVRDLSLVYATGDGPDPVDPGDPITWHFNTNGDREGWTLQNADDVNAGPRDGLWVFQVPGVDPILLSPTLDVPAGAYETFEIRMANDHNPADGSRLQVFWAGPGQGFAESRSVAIDVSNGGGWGTYTLELGAVPSWSGTIERLRVDPILHGDGHSVGVDHITLR